MRKNQVELKGFEHCVEIKLPLQSFFQYNAVNFHLFKNSVWNLYGSYMFVNITTFYIPLFSFCLHFEKKSTSRRLKFAVFLIYISFLGMTLNCIWWRGSSSGDLGRVEYPFITLTSMSTLTWIKNLTWVKNLFKDY